jgi:predicted RNase H-like HicB family nuclease
MRFCEYRALVEKIAIQDGGGWMAYYPTLGKWTVSGVGNTQQEALTELHRNREEVFALWESAGVERPVPRPFDRDANGLVAEPELEYAA